MDSPFEAAFAGAGQDVPEPFRAEFLVTPESPFQVTLVGRMDVDLVNEPLGQATSRLAWQVLPIFLVCHQAVNFHHYLVDAVIWRRRVATRAT